MLAFTTLCSNDLDVAFIKEGFVKKDLKYYAVPAKHQKMFFEALDALIVRSEKYFKER